nr:MAG TPA: hypothetical protein [Caudoviricetes sp.]
MTHINCNKSAKEMFEELGYKVELKIDKEKLLVSMLKSLNRGNYKHFYRKVD